MKQSSLVFTFVKELNDFAYDLSVMNRVWNILFPGEGEKWNHLHINKYKHIFYITHVDGDSGSLQIEPNKKLQKFPFYLQLPAVLVPGVRRLMLHQG